MNQTIDTTAAQMITELASRLNGAAFVSLDYTSKGTGERAIHLIQIGTDVERIYRDDVVTLDNMMAAMDLPFVTVSDLHKTAAAEIHSSLIASLEKGIGNNPAYTKQGYYVPVVKGVWFNPETGEVYVKGTQVSKRVIEAGTYNTVNSRPLTLAKKDIDKALKRSKIREYCVSAVNVAKIAGHVVEPATL